MELSLDVDDQDRIMYLCLLDTKFLSKVVRQSIQPSHFSSEIRQKIFKTIIEYFELYKRCPGEDIVKEIEDKIRRRRIKNDDKEALEQYLINIMSIQSFPKERVEDRLNLFVKTRVISNLTNSLLKLQDFFDIEPDRAIKIIRESIIEIDSTVGRKGAESILFDPMHNLQKHDFVTKFGIEPIDSQLGGGFKPENYVVIQGYLGSGKSWSMNHLAKMAVRFGHSPLIIPTEMSNNTVRLRFRMSFTGLTKSEIFEQPSKVKENITASMNRGADIFLLSEEEKGMNITEIPAVIEDIEAKTGKKIKLVLIDSADDILPPEDHYKNKLEANTAIHTYLKNLAKNEGLCIITTAQARREGETKYWLGPSNVADNINKFRKATVGISINAMESEKQKWYYRMWLFKNTDGGEGGRVWIKRNYERGQFVTRYGRFNRQSYSDMLENEPIMDVDKTDG